MLPPECYMSIEDLQYLVGDVGMTNYGWFHIVRATEGTFQVHDPVLLKQWPERSSKDLGFGEQLEVFGEAELTILEGLPEGGDKLASKDLTQYRFGQEIVVRRVDPAGVIERETSGGHHTMDMG